MRLLKNEMIKNVTWKVLFILFILALAVNIVAVLIANKGDKDNWREEALELRKTYSVSLEECLERGVKENYYTVFENQIDIIDYSLKHNIPFGLMTADRHILRMTGLFRILMIVFIFLTSSVIASEYEARTWKNLLMTGVTRFKLFYIKVLFCCLYAVGLLLAYFAISMACGLAAFGWKSTGVGVKIVNGNVCQINQYVEIGRIYMIFAIKLVFYIILTMITVIFLRKGVFALLLSSIVLFANNMVESFISINVLNNILPFRYLAMSDEHNAKDLLNMIIVLFTYSMILLVIARKKFEKSDLV